MIQPSLQIGGGDWAVKETKLLGTNPLLNEKLPVEIDVTNATIGTRVNKQGIIENGPKNLVVGSELSPLTSWTFGSNTNSIVVNSTTSKDPNGGFTASYFTYSGQFAGIKQLFNLQLGLTYTISIWAKSDTNTNTLVFWNETSPQTNLGLFTPTNEWVRYKTTFVAYQTGTQNINFAQDRNNSNFGSLWVWGIQLEQSSVATEYYPTTTRTNLARIDYSSGEAALLIEPQKTNIALYSQEFDNAYWLKVRASITPNVIVSPDGSLTADKLVEDTSNNNHYLWKFIGTVSNGDTRAVSIHVKKAERSVVTLQCLGVSGFQATFNLDTQTISNSSGLYGGNSPSSTTIIALANGWFRISISGVFNVSNNNSTLVTNILLSNGASQTYLGDGTSGLHIWGAQIEVGSYATSYIPTLASAVTRNADVISKTGISDLINSQEGVFFLEIAALTATQEGNKAISFSDGTFNNRIQIEFTNGNNSSSCRVVVGNSSQSSFGNFIPVTTNFTKIAFFYKLNQFKVFVNGIQFQTTGTSGSVNSANTLNNLVFGIANGSGGSLNNFEGRLKSLQLYKTALTDAQLITLTTI
jgi:hypothetical protein